MATRDAEGKFDWSKTWVADMFMSVGEDGSSRVSQVDPGMTPEMKRQREIKAGVITASVGIGLMILLFVLMTGIIAGGRVSDAAAEILSRLWIVGVIPFMVGAALIFNGMFVGRNTKQLASARETPNTKELSSDPVENYLPPADTNDLGTGGPFSVTDETTRQLQGRRK
jgi:hypothetical protein